jgi:radical SAM protein with 4Fe4S-binding SPASM domain
MFMENTALTVKDEVRDIQNSSNLCETKSFCRAAFDNLHIAIGGDAKPCCEFKGSIGNVQGNSIEEIWGAKRFDDLRTKMLRDERDKRCRKCYEAEDAGGNSLRKMFNGRGPVAASQTAQALASSLPRALDIRFSNLCNLTCRTCGPDCSTKWYAEAKRAEWWKVHRPRPLVKTFDSNTDALDSLRSALEKVESIYFAGGEPLLHEGHYAILQELIDSGRTNVQLSYNTNLTELRFGKQEVLPLWSKFENVYVSASIDGHKELGELVREGLSWEGFVKNVETIRRECPHVQVGFSITVSALNVLAVPEICTHLQAIDPDRPADIHFNVLQEPRRYSVQILPSDLKAEAKRRLENFSEYFDYPGQNSDTMRERLQPLINFMMFEDRPGKQREFRQRTLQLDEMRNRNTAETIPELMPVLNETRSQKFFREVKQSVGTAAYKLRGNRF